MNLSVPSEEVLLTGARHGDEAAIRALVAQLNPRLYRVTRAILESDAEAEDALQDTYVQAFTHLDQFRGEARFSTWITRIAINTARMHRRRTRNTEEYNTVLEHTQNLMPDDWNNRFCGPEESAAQNELAQLLERAIALLPEPLRLVFVMKEVQGMKVVEIAEALQLNAITVKTRLFRARHRLRIALTEATAGNITQLYPFDGERCVNMAHRVLQALRNLA